MPDDDSFDDYEERRRTLDRIARLLGRPLEDFLRPNQASAEETAELMSLWLSISHPAGRKIVLDCARAVAATPTD